MNPQPSEDSSPLSREEAMSMLFASLVMQHTNTAMLLLGQSPHPQTGETLRDLDGARMFIDQLEMIEFKTRGNLDKDEEQMLKGSLTALRLAFVEAVEKPAPVAQQSPAPVGESSPTNETSGEHKRFSKKY